MQLILEQVRHGILCFFFTEPPFTAVSCDEFTSAAEVVDRQAAGICTFAAFCHCCGIFHGLDIIDGEHGSALAVCISLTGDQGGSKRPHDACNVRTDRFTAGNLFKAPQNRIVVERTALHDDMVSKFRCAGYFDDLKERVLDDRVCQSGGNVGDRRAFFLRLFYFGVHKYRASGSKINRILRIESFVRKVFHRIIQRLCKCLDERTASGGTGFVELYAVNGLVLDFNALHILSSDVQDTVHVRLKECRRVVVGNRLYFTFVQHEGGFDKRLPVTGGAGVDDLDSFRKLAVNVFDCRDRRSQGISLIVMIERIKQSSVLADESGFCRGGACIYAEERFAAVCRQIFYRHLVFRVAGGEFFIFCISGKQWFQPVDLDLHLHFFSQPVLKLS